jgi:deoxycytidine triphosphate deaminase
MSVVPFIINSANKTITTSRTEYEQAGGLKGGLIFIQNFDESQVTNTDSSNATYDLRVGAEYKDHRDSNKFELSDDSLIYLQPGSAVIIETLENVQLPESRFGHIVPKVSLLQSGLSNTSSKIDPGYSGNLSITVFNLGKRTVTLKKKQQFCTLYILDIQAGVIPYSKPPKKILGTPRKSNLDKFRDFIEANQTFLTVLLLILTLLLTALQSIQILQTLNPSTQKKENSK